MGELGVSRHLDRDGTGEAESLEWGLQRTDCPEVVYDRLTEEAARRLSRHHPGEVTLVSREIGPWREVSS